MSYERLFRPSEFDMRDSDDNTEIEGSVTATGGGGDIELSSVAISNGDTVSITSLTMSLPT